MKNAGAARVLKDTVGTTQNGRIADQCSDSRIASIRVSISCEISVRNREEGSEKLQTHVHSPLWVHLSQTFLEIPAYPSAKLLQVFPSPHSWQIPQTTSAASVKHVP